MLNPNDPYIEDFVSDINRARVLKVRSVMSPLGSGTPNQNENIDVDSNLESVISLSGGDTEKCYSVVNKGEPAGILDMKDLVKALVPRVASEAGIRGKVAS